MSCYFAQSLVKYYLGMTLLASSAVAGHKLAICAVSNCVSPGSRRRVLRARPMSAPRQRPTSLHDLLSHGTRRVGRAKLCKRLDILERLVVDTVNPA